MKRLSIKMSAALALALAAGAVFAEFKAGFARVDVTPPLGIPLVGYFSHRVADGVLDPLYIDCVAVSDGTNNALIYCVDALSLSNPFVKKVFPAITAATGVPPPARQWPSRDSTASACSPHVRHTVPIQSGSLASAW